MEVTIPQLLISSCRRFPGLIGDIWNLARLDARSRYEIPDKLG